MTRRTKKADRLVREAGSIVSKRADSDVVVTYKTWKQRDGSLIRIVDMDDHHLVASVRLIESRHKKQDERHERQDWEGDDIDFGPAPYWRAGDLDNLRFEATKRGIAL